MQSGFTGHVTPKEWRWVFIFSIILVALAFTPFLWIALSNQQQSDWQFMGALHGHIEASAYLSRIRQGMEGDFLVQYLHTPESHQSVIIQPIYALLGQVSRLTADNLSPILVFHVARISVTVFMYMALYQLASTIWVRVRTRRVFLVLVSLGSGFGWLWLFLTGGWTSSRLPLDLTYSHLSPFFSGLVSIHIPLSIACLAILSAIIITILRPGITNLPTVNNSGVVAFSMSIVLILLYPEAYVLLATTLVITVFAQWYFAKQVTNREVRWLLWVLVPALPILIYYVLVIRSNPFVLEWLQQRADQIDLFQLLIAFGGILFIGIPSIFRAIRYFESDGDRYMIIWLIVASLGSLIPIDMRAHFLVAIMIPIAYFATRSIEDVWIKKIRRKYRLPLFAVLLIGLIMSNLVVVLLPLLPLSNYNPNQSAGLVMSREYGVALEWLDNQTTSSDVVLASPELSIWIPLWLGSHSVTGHPYETMKFAEKQDVIQGLYRADSEDDCTSLLRSIDGFQRRYTVSFIIYGPLEQRIGSADCLKQVPFVASFGDVEIYQIDMRFPR